MTRYGATVIDNFDDNSLNASFWNNWSAGITESSQRINIAVPTTADANRGVMTDNTVDINGYLYGFKVVSMGTNDPDLGIMMILYIGTEAAFWYYENGILSGQRTINSREDWIEIVSGVTFNINTHTYLAIGVISGNLTFAYSADNENFTHAGSVSNPYGTTATPGIETINWDTVSATTVSMDDYSKWAPAYPTRFFL